MTELEALKKMLLSADTAMAAVTFVICQLSKLFLPSPIPPALGQPPDRWAVVKEYKWVPFVLAFIVGTLLSVVYDPDVKELYVSKVRGGLQTGAYAVILYMTIDIVVKPAIEKILGRPL
jgi:hypothetical protein